MFDSIGWGEILVIAIAALFIFGPERLPTLAKDAAAGLKRVRRAITDMREQVNDTLGDDLADLRDLDLRQYHPKTFIRNQLFADEDDGVFPPIQRGSSEGSGVLLEKSPETAASGERDRDVPPPFDYDAT